MSLNQCLSKLIHTYTKEKSSPKFWASIAIFKKIPKVHNHPMDENSPNLVTLAA
jgi:hypothetical protein